MGKTITTYQSTLPRWEKELDVNLKDETLWLYLDQLYHLAYRSRLKGRETGKGIYVSII